MDQQSLSKDDLLKEISALHIQIEQLKKRTSANGETKGYLLSIEQASDAILISTSEGNYISVNDKACELVGYSREELLQMNVTDLVPADDLQKSPLRLRDIVQGTEVLMERTLLRKDGSRIAVEVSARRMSDGCIQAIIRNISERKKLQQALEESELRFRILSDSAFEALAIHENGIVIEANKAFALLFGFREASEVIGKSIFDFTTPEEAVKIKTNMASNFEGLYETVGLHPDGSRIPIAIIAKLIPYKGRQVRVAAVRDISQQKIFEYALRKSEEQYRLLFQKNPLPMWVYDRKDYRILSVNEAAIHHYGYSEQEFCSMSLFDIRPDSEKERLRERHKQAAAEQEQSISHGTWKHRKKDGTLIDVEITTGTLQSENSTSSLAVIHDVTDSLRVERALKENKEQLTLILDNIDQVVYYLHFPKGERPQVVYVSSNLEEILGITEAAYRKQEGLLDHAHPDDIPLIKATSAEIRKEKKPRTYFYRFRHGKTGEYIWLEEHVIPRFDADGNHVANFGTTRDITERVNGDRALKESEERFRMLAENALDIVYRYSLLPTPHYEYVSPSVKVITGYSPEEFYKDPYFGFRIVHPEDQSIAGRSEEVLRTGKSISNVRSNAMVVRWITKDKRIIWTETHNKPIYDNAGKVIAVEGISRDITDRQRVEKELMESEEKFRLLSNSAPIGIFLADFKGNPYYVNKKFEEITGLPYGRIVNNSWHRLIHPEDANRVVSEINSTIAGGGDYSDEFRVKNYLKGLRWVKFQVTSFKSEESDTKGWVGTIEDVTERYESESRYRQLFESNTAGVFRTSIAGEVIDCNEAFVKIFGYPSKEKIKKVNAREFYFTEQDRQDYIKDLKKEGRLNNYHLRVRSAGGEERIALANVAFFETAESGSYIEGTLIDITQSIRAERALKENERILSTLMNNLPGMAYRCLSDEAWTMHFVSNGCLQLTGFHPNELLNNSTRSFSSIVHPDDRHVGREQIRRAIDTHTPFEIEYRIITADKKTKWVWEKGEGVFDDNGKLICLEGFITDITDRKQYEAEIALSRENYKNLIDTSPIGIFIHDEEGEVMFINPTALQIMGISSLQEFNGFHMFHFVLQEYHKVIRERKQQLLKGEDKLPFITTKIRRPDGSVIDVESKATPIVYMGKPAIQVVCQDITYQRQLETERLRAEIAEESNKKLQQEIAERKNAERILSETQKYTRMLIDSSLDMICASDKQGYVTEFNAAAQRTFGYTLEEVLGKHVSMLYANPKERIRISEKFLYKSGTFAGEVINKKKGGELFTAYLSASVLKNKDGEIVGAMGVSRDITEIKRAEEQIRLSEERYRAIYSQAYIGIAQIGLGGEILQANDQYSDILGYKISELRNMNVMDVTHPDDKDLTRRLRDQITRGKIDNFTCEKKYIHKNGSVIYSSLTASLVRNAEGKPDYTICVIQDITAKKKAEEEMRLQAAKMNAIIESSSHLIWTVDDNYKLTSFNHNYAQMVRESYGVQARVGQVINKGKMVSSREYNSFWNKKYEAAFNGLPQHFETSLADKKGNVFWREIYLNPIFGADGLVKEVSGIGHDVTEKKLAEERIKQSLHEKEVLLKEVHHRVKNNLQVISSILNLQSSYVKDKNTLAMLKESQNRIKSMAFIHESLYQTKDFSNINFSEYVTNLSRNLVHSYEMSEGNIGLELDIDQVLLNLDQSIPCGLIINELITNSLKYAFRGRKKGLITVTVKQKGENMQISIADNGVGLPQKVDYRNTESLGLQLVVTLTEQLNGKIKLERTKGTRFTITFRQQQIKARI
jgi:PAS domain S-box-containing protein